MISIISQKVTSRSHIVSTVHHDTHVNIIVVIDVIESKYVYKAVKNANDIWWNAKFIEIIVEIIA